MSSFYAVRNGRIPGIYSTWKECESQIRGFSKAEFKKFSSLKEAEFFMNPTTLHEIHAKTYNLWTDGSALLHKAAGYGFVLVDMNGDVIYEEYGKLLSLPFTSPHAELTAIVEGLKYYDINIPPGSPLIVNSDCEFIVKSINIWGPTRSESDWRSKEYFDTLYPLYKWIKDRPYITIKHVSAHVGIKYNERADILAKKGCGL